MYIGGLNLHPGLVLVTFPGKSSEMGIYERVVEGFRPLPENGGGGN